MRWAWGRTALPDTMNIISFRQETHKIIHANCNITAEKKDLHHEKM